MTHGPTLVLDQGFPLILTDPQFWPDVHLEWLGDKHPDLCRDHDDWEVIRDLRLRGGVDGFVTLDKGMLNLPKEMAVLHQSRLTLVVVEEGGNDPLVATGLLMVYMPQIVKRFDEHQPQLWRLRQGSKTPESPWSQLTAIARHQNVSVSDLFHEVRLDNSTFVMS